MLIKKSGILIGVLSLLTGCSQAAPPPIIAAPSIQHLAAQLETAGMQVIQQADRLIIIIPTDSYFEPLTTTIKEKRQPALRQMAHFVKNFANKYPNSVIRVTGYTDQVFSTNTQLKLSQSYADTISAYIFDAGIAPRRIATQGRGSNEPIAGQSQPGSAALNRRVVIQIN